MTITPAVLLLGVAVCFCACCFGSALSEQPLLRHCQTAFDCRITKKRLEKERPASALGGNDAASWQSTSRGVRYTNPLLALMVALQVKALLALPLLLLAAGLIGLKSLAVGLISAAFSGASLLRSVLPSGAAPRPAAASTRVAYEVRAPQPAPPLDAAVVYPPSAFALQRQPDLRLISAAANN